MASILMPNDGTENEWMTSAPVTSTLHHFVDRHHHFVVDRQQAQLPGLMSLSWTISESNSNFESG